MQSTNSNDTGVHMDDTQELKRELENLRIKYKALQSSIESFNDILIFSIDRDYRYLAYNSAFKAASFQAYGVEVIIGMSMLDTLVNDADRIKAKHNCDRALAGEDVVAIEVYGDLIRYYFETRYNPIYGEGSRVIGVTVMSSNITARKQAEEQLRQVSSALESFSYSVSHDLELPLRSINSHAAMLREDHTANLDEEATRMLDTIRLNAGRMGMLVDDLLTFSTLGRKDISRDRVDMEELFRSVVSEIYDPPIPGPANIVIKPMPVVFGDYALLRQVCLNLVSNAIKYSSRNPAPEIEAGGSEDQYTASYYVRDNGVGFDMQYYDKLFGVFERLHAHEEFEGTGVGLAIVHRIIERHGGKMWAEAKVSEGSTFYFSLPKIQP